MRISNADLRSPYGNRVYKYALFTVRIPHNSKFENGSNYEATRRLR
jgi:hypothetical protein